MNKDEREREKELKYLIHLRNEVIKEAKKEILMYRDELNSLCNSKKKRRK